MNLKIDITKFLNQLIIPIVSFVLTVTMFFIFIGPYLSAKSVFNQEQSDLKAKISLLEEKGKILTKARENKEKLVSYRDQLNKVVPRDANASDLVGVLDVLSKANNFTNVEENKNVISLENSKNRVVEIRFNGRTTSVANALKFLEDIQNYSSKQFSLNKIELTANPEDKFTRISFNSYSTFNPDTANYSAELPVVDVLNNKNLVENLDRLLKK